MKAYRIVEDHGDGVYKTLFHGVDGSRTLPLGKWLTAVEKPVRDGSSQEKYISGFHSLKTIPEIIKYMSAFRNRLELLKIAEVEIRGNRSKEHSRANVILSSQMKLVRVLELDWRNYEG